ncbi:hypothetical protein IAW_06095 [Bacillus cereus str. Schrouff]|uniref:Ig-like domain-containing protein n=1 Tax=Bacillus cereus TaxID=1396 RepID=UPI000330D32E|nr:Ig-like domain-containing protein [Bacillus cereus]EOO04691.1 hypothetical protein IAW_06095 [Bacillus cereus str. Schrouff]EOO81594.1 hypothetical protein IGY_05820 [Bacillus cereus K-5975c]
MKNDKINTENSNSNNLWNFNTNRLKKVAMLTIAPVTMTTFISAAMPIHSFAEEIQQKQVMEKIPSTLVVNSLTDMDEKITGKAKPNSIIVVIGKKHVFSKQGKTDTNGDFSISIPKQEIGNEISVMAMNANGEKYEETTVTVKTAKPNDPTVDYIAPGMKKVTGKAEPGSKISIRVFDPKQEQIVTDYKLESPVSSDGLFSVDIAPTSMEAIVFVYAEKNGFESATQVEVGKGDELFSPIVNKVKDTDTKITGNARAGAKVIAKVGEQELGNSYVDKNGEFTVDIPKQISGTKILVSVTDGQGTSKTSEVTVIETIPSAPEVNIIKEGDTKITGNTKAGAKVVAKVGNLEIGKSQSDENGKFSIDVPKQKGGTSITVVASNSIGTSVETSIKVRETSPGAPEVNSLTDMDEKITGKAKPDTNIVVVGSNLTKEGKTDKDGNFSISIPKQPEGKVLSVMAFNTGGASEKTYVTVKTAKPNAPIVDYIAPGMKKVTGKAEPGSKISIRVFDPKQEQIVTDYKLESPVSSDGLFSVDIAPPSREALVFVYAEKNGFESATQVEVGK